MNLIYNILMYGGTLLLSPVLFLWMLFSEKRRRTGLNRLWVKRPTVGDISRPIWVHALSVGEVLSAVPLISELRLCFPNHPIAFSASTLTGYHMARERLSGQLSAIFFFPYDFRFSVRRAAGTINPALVVLVETDLWPNFLLEMRSRNVPTILVNARLSARSFRGYRRFSRFMLSMFSSLSLLCAQTEEDARRFEAIGVPSQRIAVTGNLKYDRQDMPAPQPFFPQGKILLAGSTHPGEEELLLSAYIRLKEKYPDLRLMIAPRDPRRAEKIVRMAAAEGLSAALLMGLPATGIYSEHVLVVGRMGLLEALYGLADMAFVGGSLVPEGGHNPLEAAAFGKAILAGTHTEDFDEIYSDLALAGALFRINTPEMLEKAVDDLLSHPEKVIRMGESALAAFRAKAGASKNTAALIQTRLFPSAPEEP